MTLEAAIAEALRPVIREELERALAARHTEPATPDDDLTTAQAAALAGVVPETVCDWIKAGTLLATRAGRQYRVRRSVLERHLRGEPAEPARDLDAQARRIVG